MNVSCRLDVGHCSGGGIHVRKYQPVVTATLGYSSGLAGERIAVVTTALIVLITLVVYMIVDLDRSARGTIRASDESMLVLQKNMGEDATDKADRAGAAHGDDSQ